MMKMLCWKITIDGKEVDRVFYVESYKTPEQVKRSLINHDGYPENIEVEQETPIETDE